MPIVGFAFQGNRRDRIPGLIKQLRRGFAVLLRSVNRTYHPSRITSEDAIEAIGFVARQGCDFSFNRSEIPAGLPRVGTDGAGVSLDWRVLVFTVLITLLTSLIFGLLPAWRAARTNLSAIIKEGGSRSGSGFRQNKARTILVIREVALAVVLLVGAGLLIRTAAAIYSVTPGFDTKNVLTMRMSLSSNQYQSSEALEQTVHRATERLNALPGVELSSATCCVPLEGGYGLPFKIMVRPLNQGPFTAAVVGKRFLRDSLKCSTSTWCAAVHSPNMTTMVARGWSSSTKRWPKNIGRKETLCKTGS